MAYRYALIDYTARPKVHLVLTDETLITICGQNRASLPHRYSRRSVAALRGIPDCKRCATIREARNG